MESTVDGFNAVLRSEMVLPAALKTRSLELLLAGMQSTALANIVSLG